MNILLHICCAPCEIYPVEALRKSGHKIAGLFYNPNIHPYSEYLKRKKEVEKYSKEVSLNVIYAEYDLEGYLEYIIDSESTKSRCPICWWYRMRRVAQLSKENGFEAFTTTLLGSPYQDQEVVKNIGEEVAKEAGLKFYYEDFRTGFKAAHNKAKSKGIYCQNYCGCIFSEKERIEKKGSK
ncbi:MAG: epoxyqueuosine reductase QueH [Candidatus Omnitrophota bacterium]|nr:epoxyqueuosine reductase QueH [Candidatus Omnitrophota bacterium]